MYVEVTEQMHGHVQGLNDDAKAAQLRRRARAENIRSLPVIPFSSTEISNKF